MSFDNWRVESEKIYRLDKNKFSVSVRKKYIEGLKKIIEGLEKENDFILFTEKHASPVYSLPTVIFCEVKQNPTEDGFSFVMNCFADAKVFEEYLEKIRENDEISGYFEAQSGQTGDS